MGGHCLHVVYAPQLFPFRTNSIPSHILRSRNGSGPGETRVRWVRPFLFRGSKISRWVEEWHGCQQVSTLFLAFLICDKEISCFNSLISGERPPQRSAWLAFTIITAFDFIIILFLWIVLLQVSKVHITLF